MTESIKTKRAGGRPTLLIATLAGALAVIMGAFGSHALSGRLDANLLRVYHVAVDYHFWHALALFGAGLWMSWRPAPALTRAAVAFSFGLLVFCGSLYTLALSGIHVFGTLTPIGGLAFIFGWLSLAQAAWQLPRTAGDTP